MPYKEKVTMNIVFEHIPHRGNCIRLSGAYVTPALWDIVSAIMTNTDINSEAYKARTKPCVFFQAGSDNRKGQYILLEAWGSAEEAQDFVALINKELKSHLMLDKTAIGAANVTPHGIKFYEDMRYVAVKTGCPWLAVENTEFIIFKPETNAMHFCVVNQIREHGYTPVA
jgi:hypothetical protein